MSRKIIQIDQEKCVGCGLCANACQQSAIEMVNGKAMVVRQDYCDGIGNCLPVCPVGAISFSDSDVVADIKPHAEPKKASVGCPGTKGRILTPKTSAEPFASSGGFSMLKQWPVQIKLAPVSAKYFNGANLLIAADCSAFACGNFHRDVMKNKVTLIGCPKLDAGDYTEKITNIISQNNIKSVTVARMEVPCCGGLQNAVINALKASGKFIPWQIITVGIDGRIIED